MTNKVILSGSVGGEPQVRKLSNAAEGIGFYIATHDQWVNNVNKQKYHKAQWHRIWVIAKSIIQVVKLYVNKGTKVYVEGRIQYVVFKNSENEKYPPLVTQILIDNLGKLEVLSGRYNKSANDPSTQISHQAHYFPNVVNISDENDDAHHYIKA